jgi:hypothetical protein
LATFLRDALSTPVSALQFTTRLLLLLLLSLVVVVVVVLLPDPAVVPVVVFRLFPLTPRR